MSRQPWKSAREKDRRRARFYIRERVFDNKNASTTTTCCFSSDANNNDDEKEKKNRGGDVKDPVMRQDPLSDDDNNNNGTTTTTTITKQDQQEQQQIELLLGKIIQGSRSYFSVSLLVDRFDLLNNKLISTEFLLQQLPEERLVSIFGTDYCQLVQRYLQCFMESISFMEFSVLIGRYHVVTALLLGGVTPCQRGRRRQVQYYDETKWEQQLRILSNQLLKRFFDCFPLSLSSYIVKRVVDMRLQSFVVMATTTPMSDDDDDEEDQYDVNNNNSSRSSSPHGEEQLSLSFTCGICQEQVPVNFRLIFTTTTPVTTTTTTTATSGSPPAANDEQQSSTTTASISRSTSGCCHCSFCEPCFWKDILQQIDHRMDDDDVVICPCCGVSTTTSSTSTASDAMHSADDRKAVVGGSSGRNNNNYNNNDHPELLLTPHERRANSKTKFDVLLPDPMSLKKSTKKKKKVPELDALHMSWSKAVVSSLGLCQSVRQEKLSTFTERGALPYVKGCLEAGVDIDAAVNEYGQTPLYLAAWSGNLPLVQLLLAYGANPWIHVANGDLTLDGICQAHGHWDVLKVVQRVRREYWQQQPQQQQPSAAAAAAPHGDELGEEEESQKLDPNNNTTTTTAALANYGGAWDELVVVVSSTNVAPDPIIAETLIDPSKDHPGAGSYLISNCLENVKPLVELWKRLPIDQSSPKTAKKIGRCADRSYFCDSEGWLRSILKKRVVQAFQYQFYCPEEDDDDDPDGGTKKNHDDNVIVLPHMRFLHYGNAGSALAPHTDLCRVDQATGQRSTHSFLLYLTTCDSGGETILLGDVSGEGREDVLARIKPQLGHLLLFPHDCPHEGNAVIDVPKLLIRGEMVLMMNARNITS